MTYHIPTDIERIRNKLQDLGHTRWGFLIYRCTYDDDQAWDRFITILKTRSNDRLAEEDGLDLTNNLAWSVQNDRATLEGATIEQIRTRFNAWIASDDAESEQPNSQHFSATPRYTYCIHIDKAALNSVVNLAPQPPELDFDGVGYVNLIDAVWDHEDNDEDEEDEDEEDKDDENDNTDIGWMRVGLDGLYPSVYACLQERGMYYAMYKKPPQVWVR